MPERNVDKLHEVVVPGGQGPPGSVLQGTCRNIFGIYISFQFKILPGKKCPGSPSQVISVLIATNTQMSPVRSKLQPSSVSKSNPFQVETPSVEQLKNINSSPMSLWFWTKWYIIKVDPWPSPAVTGYYRWSIYTIPFCPKPQGHGRTV